MACWHPSPSKWIQSNAQLMAMCPPLYHPYLILLACKWCILIYSYSAGHDWCEATAQKGQPPPKNMKLRKHFLKCCSWSKEKLNSKSIELHRTCKLDIFWNFLGYCLDPAPTPSSLGGLCPTWSIHHNLSTPKYYMWNVYSILYTQLARCQSVECIWGLCHIAD